MNYCDICGRNLEHYPDWYELEYGPDAFKITRFICQKCYETKDLTIYREENSDALYKDKKDIIRGRRMF